MDYWRRGLIELGGIARRSGGRECKLRGGRGRTRRIYPFLLRRNNRFLSRCIRTRIRSSRRGGHDIILCHHHRTQRTIRRNIERLFCPLIDHRILPPDRFPPSSISTSLSPLIPTTTHPSITRPHQRKNPSRTKRTSNAPTSPNHPGYAVRVDYSVRRCPPMMVS